MALVRYDPEHDDLVVFHERPEVDRLIAHYGKEAWIEVKPARPLDPDLGVMPPLYEVRMAQGAPTRPHPATTLPGRG